jgi:hypothetical protein
VPERDASQEALRHVEHIAGSKPVRGDALLGSRKRKMTAVESEETRIVETSIPRSQRVTSVRLLCAQSRARELHVKVQKNSQTISFR